MRMILEDATGEAMELPRHERLALARLLIDLDRPGPEADVQTAKEIEVQVRQRAARDGPDTA